MAIKSLIKVNYIINSHSATAADNNFKFCFFFGNQIRHANDLDDRKAKPYFEYFPPKGKNAECSFYDIHNVME